MALFLIQLSKPDSLVGCDAGVNNFLDIPVHDFIQLIQRQVNPVVGYASLREIIGADFLLAVACSNLAAARLGFCILLFLEL